MTGSIEELIPAQEQAIRLSPRDPQIGLFYSRIGCAHLLQSRTDEAIVWCEKARNATPAHPQLPHIPRLCLCSQRRDRTRRRRARRSPQAGRRRSLFQHRPLAGRRILGGAEGPRLGRNHLFRRSAQGRGAGGMNPNRPSSSRPRSAPAALIIALRRRLYEKYTKTIYDPARGLAPKVLI